MGTPPRLLHEISKGGAVKKYPREETLKSVLHRWVVIGTPLLIQPHVLTANNVKFGFYSQNVSTFNYKEFHMNSVSESLFVAIAFYCRVTVATLLTSRRIEVCR